MVRLRESAQNGEQEMDQRIYRLGSCGFSREKATRSRHYRDRIGLVTEYMFLLLSVRLLA